MFHKTTKVSKLFANTHLILWEIKCLPFTHTISGLNVCFKVALKHWVKYSSIISHACSRNKVCIQLWNIAYVRFERFLFVVWNWDKWNLQLSWKSYGEHLYNARVDKTHREFLEPCCLPPRVPHFISVSLNDGMT